MDDNFEKEIAQFGLAIKKLREIRGLTQEDIQSLTGIARSSMVEIEAGKRTPRGINILRLCVVFEITPTMLMELAFKKWQYPIAPLVEDIQKYTKHAKTTATPRALARSNQTNDEGRGERRTAANCFGRSTRTKLDRGGTACIIVIHI